MNPLPYLESFLKSIDIFGVKTDFQINHSNKFKTIIGGVFTLIFTSIVLFLFFSLGNDMIERQNPESLFSQIFDIYPKQTTISKNNYFFTFGLQDSSAMHFIDESYYTIEMVHSAYNKTVPYIPTNTNIPFERCSSENLPNNPELFDYFSKSASNLSELICIKNGYENVFDVLGTWDTDFFNEITIKIKKCVNTTQKQNCKSKEIIEERIGSSYYAFYSTDYLIDVRNFLSPAKKFGRNYFIETSLDVHKSILRTISDTELITDEGWIIDDIKKLVVPTFFNDRESFSLEDFNLNPVIVSMKLRKSNYVNIYTRRYKKIQSVMADMGGFIQITLIILFSLSYIFVRREYYENITNQIYNFEIDHNEKDNIKEKISEMEVSREIENQKLKSFKTITQGEAEINSPKRKKRKSVAEKRKKEEKIVLSLLKKKENPLNIPISEQIKSICSNNEKIQIKKNQQKKGLTSIFNQLDITFILKKFQELEKLKLLLLDENQFNLFEFLPKPIILKNSKISLNYGSTKKNVMEKKISNTSGMIYNDDDIITKAKVTRKAYDNIVKKDELTEIDKKLIDFLDEDIKNLFKMENSPTIFGSSNQMEVNISDQIVKDNIEEPSISSEKVTTNIEKYL